MAKKNRRANRMNWLLPALFALPFLCGMAAVVILWGDKIRDLISIAVKLAVIS